jgi:hypothetical protein
MQTSSSRQPPALLCKLLQSLDACGDPIFGSSCTDGMWLQEACSPGIAEQTVCHAGIWRGKFASAECHMYLWT